MSIAVQELSVTCCVPRETAADATRSRQVTDRVLSAIRDELPRLLDRMSARASSDIAFIDTLHFDVTVGAGWPKDAIAHAVATRLIRDLWRGLSDPSTVRFKDRAELFARFCLDLSQGRSFRQPWHREFAGLAMLPASGILRSLIEADADLLLAALARLSDVDLHKVCGLLNPVDAERAVTAMIAASHSGCRDLQRIADALLAQQCDDLRSPVQRLQFIVTLARTGGGTADLDTVLIANTLLRLAVTDTVYASRSINLHDFGAAAATLAALDEDAIARAIERLRNEAANHALVECHCRIGGIWLLLRHVLEEIGLATDWLAAAPGVLCVLAVTAGKDAQEAWCDPTLRNALGIPPEDAAVFAELRAGTLRKQVPRDQLPGIEHSRKWRRFGARRRDLHYLLNGLRAIGLDRQFREGRKRRGSNSKRHNRRTAAQLLYRAAYSALRAYAYRLPGFADSSIEQIWHGFLSTPATVRSSAGLVEVALAPPPLAVIWHLSGAGRARYSLPNGTEIRVEVRR